MTTKHWRVRLTCCGRDDGEYLAETWEEAETFRDGYTGGIMRTRTIDPHGYSGTGWDGHQRSGIIERVDTATPTGEDGEPRYFTVQVNMWKYSSMVSAVELRFDDLVRLFAPPRLADLSGYKVTYKQGLHTFDYLLGLPHPDGELEQGQSIIARDDMTFSVTPPKFPWESE